MARPGFRATVEGKAYDRAAYLRRLAHLPESDGERSLGTRVRSLDVVGDTANVVAVRRLVLRLRHPESPVQPNPLRRTDVWHDAWRRAPEGWRLVERRETPLAVELEAMAEEDQRLLAAAEGSQDKAALDAAGKANARHVASARAIVEARGWPRLTEVMVESPGAGRLHRGAGGSGSRREPVEHRRQAIPGQRHPLQALVNACGVIAVNIGRKGVPGA